MSRIRMTLVIVAYGLACEALGLMWGLNMATAHGDPASDFLSALQAHGKPVVGATLGGGYQLCSMIRGGADPAQLSGAWAFYAPEAQQYLCPDTLHR